MRQNLTPVKQTVHVKNIIIKLVDHIKILSLWSFTVPKTSHNIATTVHRFMSDFYCAIHSWLRKPLQTPADRSAPKGQIFTKSRTSRGR